MRTPIDIDIDYVFKAIVGTASPLLGVITSYQDGHSGLKSAAILIPVSEIHKFDFICSHHYEIIMQNIV